MTDLNYLNEILPAFKNGFYHAIGALFLALSKGKYWMRGYSSPKPFSISECDRCIEYDFHIVDHWLSSLQTYLHADNFLPNRHVLELGPGSDLGAGLYLLSKGAAKYSAVDANDLVYHTPYSFYELFLNQLKKRNPTTDIEYLRNELDSTLSGNNGKLNYLLCKDFNIASAFPKASIDIVFSQAAFEHFDDVRETIRQLTMVCKPGAVLIVEIDLKTHSRWIREKDPNNIYRYSEWFYKLFSYSGAPNRFRPIEYEKIFKEYHWEDIRIIPLTTIENDDLKVDSSYLNKRFRHEQNLMHYSSIVLCARRAKTTQMNKICHPA